MLSRYYNLFYKVKHLTYHHPKAKDIKNRAKSEIEETKALARILTYAVKSYSKNRDFDLDKKDIEFIQGQSGDVIKNLLMVVISIIPIPIPIPTSCRFECHCHWPRANCEIRTEEGNTSHPQQ